MTGFSHRSRYRVGFKNHSVDIVVAVLHLAEHVVDRL